MENDPAVIRMAEYVDRKEKRGRCYDAIRRKDTNAFLSDFNYALENPSCPPWFRQFYNERFGAPIPKNGANRRIKEKIVRKPPPPKEPKMSKKARKLADSEDDDEGDYSPSEDLPQPKKASAKAKQNTKENAKSDSDEAPDDAKSDASSESEL
jgi:hypothetical protein